MLRETMTSTMPVAMIAMPDAWTASVIMLVGWMNLPPLRMLEREQDQATRAMSIPNRRRSISVCGDQIADRGRAGRLGLTGYRCRVGHVLSRRPSWSCEAKRPAPPGDRGGAGSER